MGSIDNAAARGQRRGFFWQDWYAAWVMLRAIARPNEGIVAVEVEAANATHVDDIVIHQEDAIIYRQLKHTVKDNERLTGADLFGKDGDKPTLINKLYRGWKRVSGASSLPIEIRLTTNAAGSSDSRNLLVSPVEFEERILSKARQATWSPSSEEMALLEKVRALTDAPDVEALRAFLADLYLDYGAPHEADLMQEVMSLLSSKYLRSPSSLDLEAKAWAQTIYDLSTRHGEIGPLSRNRIETELRQLVGYSQRSEHRLALPKHHLERKDICEEILARARALSEGYLLVVGPPGCGKTTLATWIANTHDEELLMRYHAFDPRQASSLEREGRASAYEFVSTMFDVLADRFPGKASRRAPSADRLADAVGVLRDQLASLATSKTRFVLVDGIDHVVRAGLDHPTLFDAIPRPVPEGVVFILFGQPDWDYPGWLKRIEPLKVSPFSASENRALICQSLGWAEDDAFAAVVCDIVHEKTAGNPLSLFYSIRVLEKLRSSAEAVAKNLPEAALFGASPDAEYESLLDDLEARLPAPQGSRSLRREMLACIAVAVASVTEERLSVAFAEDGLTKRQARDFLIGLGPILAERGRGHFWIFHDDFRRYAEERTSQEERSLAHRRFAAAVEEDWTGDEAGALAEHYWLGEEDEKLAAFPHSRNLEDWFAACSPRVVVTVHRLALAAAFRSTDELLIMRNALAHARAHEAAALPWHASGPAVDLGLKPWLRQVPPLGNDFRSLERRTLALEVAATHYAAQPELARQVAMRFEASLDALAAKDDPSEHAAGGYVQALVSWRLHCGDLPGVALLLQQERLRGAALTGVAAELSRARDLSLPRQWARAFAGVDEELDHRMVKAAVEHLVEGRDELAKQIIDELLQSEAIGEKIRRDTTVLLALLQGQLRKDPAFDCAHVKWREYEYSPIEWRDFFFRGFAETAMGSALDLSAAVLPKGALSEYRFMPETEAMAKFLWKVGNACGLVMRNYALVPEMEFQDLLEELLPVASRLEGRDAHARLGCAGLLLPLVARAIQGTDRLASLMVEYLTSYAGDPLLVPAVCRYGYLEALWHLRPDVWRTLAQEAYQRTLFPGTEAYERTTWCEYWLIHGEKREVNVPPGFAGLLQTTRLGASGQTDPAALAVMLVCKEPKPAIVAARIVQLITLLVRLNEEPEGDRAAHRHLPGVLALALDTDPHLFEAQFVRCTSEGGMADAFCTLPAEITDKLLASDLERSGDELMGLWYWMAAAPGSVDDQDEYGTIKQRVVDRLTLLGLDGEAEVVRSWPSLSHSKSINESTEGRSKSEGDDGSESLLNIANVDFKWFSAWWGSEGYRTLKKHLDAGGDEAWREVCRLLGEKAAQSLDVREYDSWTVAEEICELRPDVSRDGAIDLAMDHLSHKVRFQTEPIPVVIDRSERKGFTDVLIGLIARGIDVTDVETVRRSLRSLAALAARPGTREAVIRQMRRRLHADDVRLVQKALLLLRRAKSLKPEVLDDIRALEDHPDAWCRYLACQIRGVKPHWPKPRAVGSGPGIVAPEAKPTVQGVGSAYYSDTASIREVLLRNLGSIVPHIQEETLRAWLETELRSLPDQPDGWLGWDQSRGPSLSDGRMSAAAGRLACRLASTVLPGAVPTILAAVAGFDPWLALEPPIRHPFKGWIELCRTEKLHFEEHGEYLQRSIGVVHRGTLSEAGNEDHGLFAKFAWNQLGPESPERYGWVAEPWPKMLPPGMPREGVDPLAAHNALFTQLTRDRFDLIPAFGNPAFRNLRYDMGELPAWYHPDFGRVIVPAHGERPAVFKAWSHPVMDWWAGWYASSEWVTSVMGHEDVALIRFWRKSAGPIRDDDGSGERTVEYGFEEVVLSAER